MVFQLDLCHDSGNEASYHICLISLWGRNCIMRSMRSPFMLPLWRNLWRQTQDIHEKMASTGVGRQWWWGSNPRALLVVAGSMVSKGHDGGHGQNAALVGMVKPLELLVKLVGYDIDMIWYFWWYLMISHVKNQQLFTRFCPTQFLDSYTRTGDCTDLMAVLGLAG